MLGETALHYKWQYAAAFVLLGIVSATTAATAWLMKDVINEVFIAKSQSALIFVAVAVLVIYVARGAASYGQGVILYYIGTNIVTEGQNRLVRKLLQEDVGEILSRTSSEVIQKQVLTAEAARTLMNLLITVVARDFLTLVGLVIVMVTQDLTMALIVLVLLPIAAALVGNLGKRVQGVVKKHVVIGISIADQLRQATQGFKVVKAFGIEQLIGARLGAVIEDQRKNANKFAVLHARTQPIVETLAGIAVALVILYGGWRVISHGATPGAFFSFITALLLAYDPARRLASARVQVEHGLVGLRMFYEMMDREPASRDRDGAADLLLGKGEIRFEDVTFAYETGGPVLEGLNLTFEPGKTTALVGGSGSGKSTILSLILRFWSPQAGRISVDGQDIAGLNTASLRASMAYVGQDSFLFDGTVRDNILIGRPDADMAAVEAAARAAHAHEFILELPEGYETPVGELASRLSGGQKQRIAIARAFLRDAEIVLLDEPTAALDAHAEEAIRATLNDLAKGRTTILIAHRLASVTGADTIAILDAGRVIEQGSHAELLAAKGLYQRLYQLQSGQIQSGEKIQSEES